MSRSGYSYYGEAIGNLYRANVERSLAGKRGQKYLRKLIEALDAMEVKELHAIHPDDDGLFEENNVCKPCTLGAVALREGWEDPTNISASYHEGLGKRLNVPSMLIAEVEWENDEGGPQWYRSESPEERWARMRAWAVRHLKEETEV